MKNIIAEVAKQEKLIEDIYSLYLKCPEIVEEAHSGQFVSLYTNDPSRLLPRPISIAEIDKKSGILRVIYRVAGEGTRQFSQLKKGDTLRMLGPTGNGYDLSCSSPILMGGGIGIPPMLQLAKELSEKGLGKEDITVVLGFRDDTFLVKEFSRLATVYISSDSGKNGVKGTVIDAAHEYGISGDMIYACGPKPMLRGVKKYAFENDIEAQLSLEERMACGVGACLACVTKTTEVDDHSKVYNARICVDGPVFRASDIEI